VIQERASGSFVGVKLQDLSGELQGKPQKCIPHLLAGDVKLS
jgi:hypothetical protein